MAPLEIDSLKPYRSYTFVKIRLARDARRSIELLLDHLADHLRDRESAETIDHQPWIPSHRSGLIHYRIERAPGWMTDSSIVDVSNELTLVLAHRAYLSIYCSESWARTLLARSIRDSQRDGDGTLSLLDSRVLESALLQDKEHRTLWLSGIHRRTPSKADNKVLSGTDLRFALDPLGDQSYCFTAARAKHDQGSSNESIGVAPRKSGAWIGVASGWIEHRNTARRLIERIDGVDPTDTPALPVLAQSAPAGVSVSDLGEPFEACFVPPELLESNVDDGERMIAEELGRLSLTPRLRDSGQLELTVYLAEGDRRGPSYLLDLDLSNPQRIRWSAIGPSEVEAEFAEVDQLVKETLHRRPGWMKVWFESGYVLSNCSIFRAQHRDLLFPGWYWERFNGFDITKEKPANLKAEEIGHEDSLFCWVATREQIPWASGLGWLASNDGAMEIADFIHVDPESRQLSLVHVKGAKSSSTNRKVSVSSYEIVVGQAVKNLRHLDHELLAGGFLESLDRRLRGAVWRDGQFVGEEGRGPMKEAIESLGTHFNRQVVIIQPHVRQTALDAARASPSRRDKLAAQQLNTLLLSARASCLSVGAELFVVGEEA